MSSELDGEEPVYHELLQFAIELDLISGATLKYLDNGGSSVSEIRSRNDIRAAFEPLVNRCVAAVDLLMERVREDAVKRGIDGNELEALNSECQKLSVVFEERGLIAPERAFASASRIEEVIERLSLKEAALPREPVKNIKRELERLKLRCSAYELHKARKTISNLIPQIRKKARTLKAYSSNGQKKSLIDVRRSITFVENVMRPSIEGNGISFEVTVSEGDYKIPLDRQKFEYCLKLLLDNALKYTHDLPEDTGYEEPWIKVRSFDRGDSICLTVDSWGTPITHEELEKRLIFKRGFRGHFAITSGIDGTGTGLAEVEEFLQSIGGSIDVDTRAQSKFKEIPQPQRTVFDLRMPKP